MCTWCIRYWMKLHWCCLANRETVFSGVRGPEDTTISGFSMQIFDHLSAFPLRLPFNPLFQPRHCSLLLSTIYLLCTDLSPTLWMVFGVWKNQMHGVINALFLLLCEEDMRTHDTFHIIITIASTCLLLLFSIDSSFAAYILLVPCYE